MPPPSPRAAGRTGEPIAPGCAGCETTGENRNDAGLPRQRGTGERVVGAGLIFSAILLGLGLLDASGRQESGTGGGRGAAPFGSADARSRHYVGEQECRDCHEEKFQSFGATAHANTSALATPQTIHGDFHRGSNQLRTANPNLYFQMEERNGGSFETAVLRTSQTDVLTRSERIDIVVGSGRKGQTYLFWDGDQLFQLPVSYWSQSHAWVNSPGYVDGEANFERPIARRCLECHATSFETRAPPENTYVRDSLVLGIACEKCHGPGSEHVALYRSAHPPSSPAEGAIVNPARLSRDRQIDTCALCHAGIGRPLTVPLSFKPGDTLAEHLVFEKQLPGAHLDVHASQVQLLAESRCFQSSAAMTCSTCHDVHKPQRDLAAMSLHCVSCHQVDQCGEFARRGRAIASQCVVCHMPLERTEKILITGRGGDMDPSIRNHRIAIYRDAAPE